MKLEGSTNVVTTIISHTRRLIFGGCDIFILTMNYHLRLAEKIPQTCNRKTYKDNMKTLPS